MDMTALSKTVAHALRHEPWQYALVIDDDGWTPVQDLLHALQNDERFADVTAETLSALVDADDKGRYQINGGRIRALYGHSFPLKIVKTRCVPPDVLYHGTARRFLTSILQDGLTPQKRQYVHLAADATTARNVGQRRDGKPALLVIDAARAHADGVAFYTGNEKITLADTVPPQYISLL